MPVLDPPIELLLEAFKATIDPIDYETETGLIGLGQVNVRHGRNRPTVESDGTCLAIVFEDDDYRSPNDASLTNWETVREMLISLQCDYELPPEDTGLDPTGFGGAARILAAATTALMSDTSPIGLISDWRVASTLDPQDGSSADFVRLVRTIAVVYRVRTEEPNELLAQGVNAT